MYFSTNYPLVLFTHTKTPYKRLFGLNNARYLLKALTTFVRTYVWRTICIIDGKETLFSLSLSFCSSSQFDRQTSHLDFVPRIIIVVIIIPVVAGSSRRENRYFYKQKNIIHTHTSATSRYGGFSSHPLEKK